MKLAGDGRGSGATEETAHTRLILEYTYLNNPSNLLYSSRAWTCLRTLYVDKLVSLNSAGQIPHFTNDRAVESTYGTFMSGFITIYLFVDQGERCWWKSKILVP